MNNDSGNRNPDDGIGPPGCGPRCADGLLREEIIFLYLGSLNQALCHLSGIRSAGSIGHFGVPQRAHLGSGMGACQVWFNYHFVFLQSKGD
ncbi:hypothetical protein Mapa_003368 [Marchantia paleacea]|nr:hypothetical protein Mapa_003368 [Marchantia paleacea]